VLSRHDYEVIAENRSWLGDFDPFGDFDLIFGARAVQFENLRYAGALWRAHLWRNQYPALEPRLDAAAHGRRCAAPHQVQVTAETDPTYLEFRSLDALYQGTA